MLTAISTVAIIFIWTWVVLYLIMSCVQWKANHIKPDQLFVSMVDGVEERCQVEERALYIRRRYERDYGWNGKFSCWEYRRVVENGDGTYKPVTDWFRTWMHDNWRMEPL